MVEFLFSIFHLETFVTNCYEQNQNLADLSC